VASRRPVAYAVAYTGPQRDSAAVCSVQVVRSEAETSIAAGFKTTAFVHSATPPRRDSIAGLLGPHALCWLGALDVIGSSWPASVDEHNRGAERHEAD
jgi:hypothetical protein